MDLTTGLSNVTINFKNKDFDVNHSLFWVQDAYAYAHEIFDEITYCDQLFVPKQHRRKGIASSWLQDYIKENFYGEQGVGTSFIIKTDIPNLSLIHTPTMQYPSKILDDMIVYYCMRSTLICALKNDIKSIVIPVFGGACGCVEPEITSKRLKDAYMQILNNIGVKYRF